MTRFHFLVALAGALGGVSGAMAQNQGAVQAAERRVKEAESDEKAKAKSVAELQTEVVARQKEHDALKRKIETEKASLKKANALAQAKIRVTLLAHEDELKRAGEKLKSKKQALGTAGRAHQQAVQATARARAELANLQQKPAGSTAATAAAPASAAAAAAEAAASASTAAERKPPKGPEEVVARYPRIDLVAECPSCRECAEGVAFDFDESEIEAIDGNKKWKKTLTGTNHWFVNNRLDPYSTTGGERANLFVRDVGAKEFVALTRESTWIHCMNGRGPVREYQWPIPYGERDSYNTNSFFQAHHVVQDEWAKSRFAKLVDVDGNELYSSKLAPSVLLLTGGGSKVKGGQKFGSNHEAITLRQKDRRDRSSAANSKWGWSYAQELAHARNDLGSPDVGAVPASKVAEIFAYFDKTENYYCSLWTRGVEALNKNPNAPDYTAKIKQLKEIFVGSNCPEPAVRTSEFGPPRNVQAAAQNEYGQCSVVVRWDPASVTKARDVKINYVQPSDPTESDGKTRWKSTRRWQQETQVKLGGNSRDCDGTFWYQACADYGDAGEFCMEKAVSIQTPPK